MKRIATLLLGAAALFGASAAVPNFTVDPAGWQQSYKDFVLTFDGPVTTNGLSINVTAVLESGETTRAVNTGKADGNQLKFSLLQNAKVGAQYVLWGFQTSPMVEGPMTFEIKGYSVDGVEGDPIKLEYYISDTEPVTDFSYTVDPKEGWQKEIKTVTLTFNGEVNTTKASATVSYQLEAGGVDERGMYPTSSGNTMTITLKNTAKVGNSGITSLMSGRLGEGDFTFVIKGYTVDGEEGDPITITYYISNEEPGDPNEPAEWTLTPENNSTVDELKNITLAYGNSTLKWGETSERSFYWDGYNGGKYNVGSDSEYGVDGKKLTIALPKEAYYTPGNYTLKLPAGSVLVDGVSTTEDMEYTVKVANPDLTDARDFEYTVSPDTDGVLKELKQFDITFTGATNVELRNWFRGNVMYSLKSAEDAAAASNENWFANDGIFGGVKVEGNKVTFGSISNINVGNGSFVYIYICPGALLIDGVPNKAINLKYYVNPSGVASFFSEYDLTPAQGEVKSLEKIEMDLFDAVDYGEIALVQTAGSLKVGEEASDAAVTLTTDGEEIINITIAPAQTAEGSYAVTIPAGAFTVAGIASPEYVFNYTISGEEPPVNPGEGEYAPKAPEDLVYTKTVVRTYTDKNDNTKEYRVRQDYGKIEFSLPITYANGREGEISKDKLFFRVLINEADSVFTFQGPDYIKWDQNGYEPMTWVNDLFQDTWDFGSSDRSPIDGVLYPTKHSVYMYGIQDICEKIGVQSKYDRNSKNSFESTITWAEPVEQDLEGTISVEEYQKILDGEDSIDSIFMEGGMTEYFDLQGNKVSGNEKGIFICRQVSAEGSVRVVKVVK